jgi:hypothetical protein
MIARQKEKKMRRRKREEGEEDEAAILKTAIGPSVVWNDWHMMDSNITTMIYTY